MLACWVALLVLTNRNYFPTCSDFRVFPPPPPPMDAQMYISSLKGNQGTWGEENTADDFCVSSLILSKEKLSQERELINLWACLIHSAHQKARRYTHTAPFILVSLLYISERCIHPFRGSQYILSFWTVPHSPAPEVHHSSNINLGGHQPCILDHFQLKEQRLHCIGSKNAGRLRRPIPKFSYQRWT